jgi:hypothetical protein
MACEQKPTIYNNAELHMRAMSQSLEPKTRYFPRLFLRESLRAAGNPVRNWIVFNSNSLYFRECEEGSKSSRR